MLGVLQGLKWLWFGLMFIASFSTDMLAGILVTCRLLPPPEIQNSTRSEYPHTLILQGTTEVHFCYQLFNYVDLKELDAHPLSIHALKLFKNIT